MPKPQPSIAGSAAVVALSTGLFGAFYGWIGALSSGGRKVGRATLISGAVGAGVGGVLGGVSAYRATQLPATSENGATNTNAVRAQLGAARPNYASSAVRARFGAY